jgi:hypothetical protein
MSRVTKPFMHVAGFAGKRRHIAHSSGPDSRFPHALCDERIALKDDATLPPCRECRLIATTEIALGLDFLGYLGLAIDVATALRDEQIGEAVPIDD